MTEPVTLNEFRKLGYLCQLPSATDKTYFLTKQTDNGARQIYIMVFSKSAKVEVLQNYKKSTLDKRETRLMEKLIFGDLQLLQYELI